MVRTALLSLVTGLAALAQQKAPALAVDASADRHTISSDIYGVNFHWDLGSSGDPNGPAYAAVAPAPGVRARISPDVQPGNPVPVHVTVGGAASQDGITLAVR